MDEWFEVIAAIAAVRCAGQHPHIAILSASIWDPMS